VRTLHLGTAGEPDGETVFVQYNALLVDPAQRGPAAAALVASLERLRWHELRLDGFLPQDADALLAARPGAETDRVVCRTVPLADDPDAVVEAFSPSVRKVLRRGLRRLGDVTVQTARTAEEALDVLDDLKRLSDARWAQEERTGAFASPRFVAFHRALIARLAPEGRVLLVRVATRRARSGAATSSWTGGKALAYQIGRRLEEDNRVSAGQVVELLVMQACAERGLAVYSHQSGDTEHKRRLSSARRSSCGPAGGADARSASSARGGWPAGWADEPRSRQVIAGLEATGVHGLLRRALRWKGVVVLCHHRIGAAEDTLGDPALYSATRTSWTASSPRCAGTRTSSARRTSTPPPVSAAAAARS
jgi:hypothetical protein